VRREEQANLAGPTADPPVEAISGPDQATALLTSTDHQQE